MNIFSAPVLIVLRRFSTANRGLVVRGLLRPLGSLPSSWVQAKIEKLLPTQGTENKAQISTLHSETAIGEQVSDWTQIGEKIPSSTASHSEQGRKSADHREKSHEWVDDLVGYGIHDTYKHCGISIRDSVCTMFGGCDGSDGRKKKKVGLKKWSVGAGNGSDPFFEDLDRLMS
eukprot:gene22235-29302_t